MSSVWMLVAMMLLLGIALFFYNVLDVSSLEGVLLAVVTVIGAMYAGLWSHHLRIGVLLVVGMAVLGVISLWRRKKRNASLADFFSPGLMALLVLYTGTIFAFRGDFIQNIDDLHQWAAAVRYMYYHSSLPVEGEFIGTSSQPMLPCVFTLFFQKIGGYNEGNMYVSSFLFSAVGALLPLFALKWKEWKRVFLYVGVVYIGLFSLYVHPYKSLYVDLPVAMWSAGICLWWLELSSSRFETDLANENVKSKMRWPRWMLLVAALFVISQIKWAVGLLFCAFVVFYMMVFTIVDKGMTNVFRYVAAKKFWLLGAAAVIVAGGAGLYMLKGQSLLPGSVQATVEALTVSSEKAKLTLGTLMTNLIEKPLSEYSNQKITLLPFLVATVFVLLLSGWVVARRKQKIFLATIVYALICAVAYVAVLYVTYVSTFSYEESIKNAAVHRYFSIIAIFLFVLAVGTMLGRYYFDSPKKSNVLLLAVLAVGVFFATGISDKFLCKATSLDKESVYGYKAISETKKGLKELNKIISKEDKVYLLAQNMTLAKMNEFPMTVALYYEENRVSNYLKTPWKFQEGGSLQFVANCGTTIDQWKDILKTEHYTYIWLFRTDDYIRAKIPELFGYAGEVDKGLYQIVYENGEITGLQYVTKLGEN